jgi:hypothetical protein
MTPRDSVVRFISMVLLRHASHACPPQRAKWVASATNEIDSISSPYETLKWSLGTVWASYKERFCAMSIAEPQLPRLLITLEVLTCFLPNSLLWVWALRAAARHILPAAPALCLTTAASIGPIGLLLFGQVALGNPWPPGRCGSVVLISLAGWIAVVILLLPLSPSPFMELPWRDCVLLIILPLIGAAHYALLERGVRSNDAQTAI